MRDAGGTCGQLADSVESWGEEIFDADREKNVVFSIHQYGFWVDPGSPKAGTWDGHQPYDIDAELTKLQATGLPLVIGEFRWETFHPGTYDTRPPGPTDAEHGGGWPTWRGENTGGAPTHN